MSTSTILDDDKHIMSLRDDEDTKSLMLLNLVEGLDLHKAIRHPLAACARDGRWGGVTQPHLSKTEKEAKAKTLAPNFEYLDHTEANGDMSAHERLDGNSVIDLFEIVQIRKSLMVVLDEQSESILDIVCVNCCRFSTTR